MCARACVSVCVSVWVKRMQKRKEGKENNNWLVKWEEQRKRRRFSIHRKHWVAFNPHEFWSLALLFQSLWNHKLTHSTLPIWPFIPAPGIWVLKLFFLHSNYCRNRLKIKVQSHFIPCPEHLTPQHPPLVLQPRLSSRNVNKVLAAKRWQWHRWELIGF